ncbi:TetR/AcrR family transcriptional regulator [Clostridium sp.]
MARPIEYDKDVVLSKAMKVFWRFGYDSTSMKDLVEATGMTTRSMYNIFDSKNGLFKAVLEWYYEINISKPFEKLVQGKGIAAIKEFLLTVANFEATNGCLYTNTSSDRNCINTDSLEIVDKYFNALEETFKSKLMYAKSHEGYKDDPELRAKQLVVMIQGLSVYTKNRDTKKDYKIIIEDFLSLIGI